MFFLPKFWLERESWWRRTALVAITVQAEFRFRKIFCGSGSSVPYNNFTDPGHSHPQRLLISRHNFLLHHATINKFSLSQI